VDANRRGFLEATFTPEVATAELNFVGDITVNANITDEVATNNQYAELAADGTQVPKIAKFKIYPNSSGRSDANTLIPSS
jgi:hypothetical protein